MKQEANVSYRNIKSRDEYMKIVSSCKDLIKKEQLISELCKGKDVLDIGCIDHSFETALALGDDWLHKCIKAVSRSIIGMDILGEDIRKLNEKGFNIINANAESFDLNRTFDVIIAGDLIEHLSNIGLFLTSVRKHMHSHSVCVITTPNPFNIEQSMKAIFENHISVNREHTTWLDPVVMYETVIRSGLEIVDFRWIETRFKIQVHRIPYKYFANFLSNIIMKKRPICRRDYAVIVRKAVQRIRV